MKPRWIIRISLMTVLALTGAMGLWFFSQRQRAYTELFFIAQAQQRAEFLVRMYIQEGAIQPNLEEDIIGFAIYRDRGVATFMWGTAPQILNRAKQLNTAPFVYDFDPQTASIDLHFNLETQRPRLMQRNPNREPPLAFAYLKLKAPKFLMEISLWQVLTLGLPLLWIALVIAANTWFQKWLKLKTALAESQEQSRYAGAGATLAHEIRNPLAIIKLQTSLLRQVLALSSQQVAEAGLTELTIIEEETARINHLVQKVRDYLIDPLGKPEQLNPCQVAEELCRRFNPRPTLIIAGASLEDCLISFDPGRFRSVLENLLKNAQESSPQSTVELHIGMHSPQQMYLDVVDYGPGFSANILEGGRKPFNSTKTNGSGLGLTMSESFIRAAKGSLILENRLEGGARARIILPIIMKGT